jgi:hypothetical protein
VRNEKDTCVPAQACTTLVFHEDLKHLSITTIYARHDIGILSSLTLDIVCHVVPVVLLCRLAAIAAANAVDVRVVADGPVSKL